MEERARFAKLRLTFPQSIRSFIGFESQQGTAAVDELAVLERDEEVAQPCGRGVKSRVDTL